jgi:hypothetical protein
MTYVPEKLKQQVEERAKRRCEYCQTQMIVIITLQVEHIYPSSKGGETSLDNLCLACSICNNAKKAFLTGIDPQTGQESRLFNPRSDVWAEHFIWIDDGAKLEGLTPIGRATVQRLNMNRIDVVESRQFWVKVGWHPPK